QRRHEADPHLCQRHRGLYGDSPHAAHLALPPCVRAVHRCRHILILEAVLPSNLELGTFHASDPRATLVGVGVFVRAAVVLAAVAAPAPATAAPAWFPHPPDATWTYEWADSVYATTPTEERVTVKEQQ